MWRFLTITFITVLVIGIVTFGIWNALDTGSPLYPADTVSASVSEAAPPVLESPIEILSPHSARASLGQVTALSVTLQVPTARGVVVSVTVPVEVELSLDVAVTGGRAGILGYRQQTIPVVEVQPLLMQQLFTSASSEEVLFSAPANILVPTPTPTRPQVFAQVAPPSVASNVNMRQGPDTTFAIVGKVRSGDTFAVVARNADASWYRVMHSDGTTGWIAAYLVQGGPAPETLAIAASDAP